MRSMFMLASRADSSIASMRAGVTRFGNMSIGITFAPLAKMGTPFTTKAKLLPH